MSGAGDPCRATPATTGFAPLPPRGRGWGRGSGLHQAPTTPCRQRCSVSPAPSESAGRGFSLIELLVAVTLIALLATLALPLQELAVQRGREMELRTALRQIRDALDAYRQAVEDGRVVTGLGDSGYPKTLDVLVEGVKDAKSPAGERIYFLRRIPRDPFADPDRAAEASWGLRSYQSPHDNPRPGRDVFDVYSLSDGTGINGVPYRDW